jgi:hypothetical protein
MQIDFTHNNIHTKVTIKVLANVVMLKTNDFILKYQE